MATNQEQRDLEQIFPVCRMIVGEQVWQELLSLSPKTSPENLPAFLADFGQGQVVPPYLPELARLERTFNKATMAQADFSRPAERPVLNPTLEILELSWENLASLLFEDAATDIARPEKSPEWVVVFRGPQSQKMRCRPATDQELLALKVVAADLNPDQVALENHVPLGVIDRALSHADRMGLTLAPESKIRRNPAFFTGRKAMEQFQIAPVFTLQWHITQSCDLHCRHCYDRSSMMELELDQGMAILDDFKSFCRSRHVDGHISFTGGNPLLYPHFNTLYQQAADLGFSLGILGNPAAKERIEEIMAISEPVFYQVSLEGLREQNDFIRGPGHFDRVIDFLSILKDLDLYSMVMLTLTEDNRDQVLPLAEELRNKTDLFTFNRLSLTGEGAQLQSTQRDGFESFLQEYIQAAKTNPVISLKDNLLNIIRYREGGDLFGGCAGFGCGAAFNFVSLLPDGEVHSCRKFPSPIGNIFEQSLAAIYDGPQAEQYRNGPQACNDCPIRPVCGGCLAVGHGMGIDIFTEQDPYCFMSQTEREAGLMR